MSSINLHLPSRLVNKLEKMPAKVEVPRARQTKNHRSRRSNCGKPNR